MQYRTVLNIPREATDQHQAAVRATFTTENPQTTREMIQKVLPGATLSGPIEKASAIYHPDINGGKKPCGSTGPWTVTEGFDVETTTNAQFNQGEKVAA